jgi:signal transduction histidine kinase
MVVITSRMDPATNTIYIHVEDNGKGIPKDKLGRIFMPFFTTKGSKGTGLGLSMTKKYIEDMFGTISVESEEGRGTRFTIALPPVQPKAMAYDYDIETRDARTRGLDL